MNSTELRIYTDASSRNNQKDSPGVRACLCLRYQKNRLIDWFIYAEPFEGTSNRIELAAAIWALQLTRKNKQAITIFSDSKYVINGAKHLIAEWKKKQWKTIKGSTIANTDLWLELEAILKERSIHWQHVRAHASCTGNNIADAACKLCWAAGAPIQLSGLNKSEHLIENLIKRKLYDHYNTRTVA